MAIGGRTWGYDQQMLVDPTFSSFVSEFEAGNIDTGCFSHPDHVRVIWTMIHQYGTLEAVGRFERALKMLTENAGIPDKYHTTITYALTFIVGERIDGGGALEWDVFAAANPDLFVWPNAELERMYPDGILDTDLARRSFVLTKAAR